ncbi:MAG TPA: class I SAM-dependent methyltransferase [Ignavibacteria bacterium]|jgi:ubiquinone/menaquinone biosynthesis C-methylase UbiE
MEYKWNNAKQYEQYVGRWSRLAAAQFLKWVNQDKGLAWIDVGCGSGALTDAILKSQNPGKVTGIDPSEDHIQFLSENIIDPRAEFFTGDASSLPVGDKTVDVVVSGLVLNFINDIPAALNEFKRASRNGSVIAAYVWDYSDKMEMIRYFWDAAVSLFDNARGKDQGERFKICNPDLLREAFFSAGLKDVEITNIDIPTVFKNFDDYWNPFLSGVGPAPGYCMSLSEENRQRLKDEIYNLLPINEDGSIHLIARAIGVKGVK